MIIDTNGFEIGDEVWVIFQYYTKEYKPFYTIIYNFQISKDGLFAQTPLGFFELNRIYGCKDESNCQLACDRLNGVSHD